MSVLAWSLLSCIAGYQVVNVGCFLYLGRLTGFSGFCKERAKACPHFVDILVLNMGSNVGGKFEAFRRQIRIYPNVKAGFFKISSCLVVKIFTWL